MRDFEHWYATARDPVFRAIVAVTRDSADAADLTAEAFVRAYERWNTLSHHDNPTAWVMRVAVNLHVSAWRRLRRRASARPVAVVAPPEPPFDEHLRLCVLALPHRQRQVVALRILVDLSTAETADALGLSEGAVKAHLHRALTSLRQAQFAERPTAVESDTPCH